MTLNAVYDCIEHNNINLYNIELESTPSLSVDGVIGLDRTKVLSMAQEKVILAHELGHCVTGSFYNIHATCDIRGKHEHRADVWSYKVLLPYDALKQAIRDGYTEVWQIAEYFDLTEEFTAKAIMYYKEQEIA